MLPTITLSATRHRVESGRSEMLCVTKMNRKGVGHWSAFDLTELEPLRQLIGQAEAIAQEVYWNIPTSSACTIFNYRTPSPIRPKSQRKCL